MDDVGAMLREWRERRRLTQLELALDAGISTRHLSFVETGRSKPGREMLLRILEQLDLPYRERNRMLLAAGHAPAFPERSFEDASLAPVREAIDLILRGHEPFPAVLVDRRWNVVATNAPMQAMTSMIDIDPALLEPPVNAFRVGFHPRGLGPWLANPAAWEAYFRERVERQAATTGDDGLVALFEEAAAHLPGGDGEPDGSELLGPLKVRSPLGGELSFLGMFAGFGTPFEVTTSELAIELLFPADAATSDALHALPFARDRARVAPQT